MPVVDLGKVMGADGAPGKDGTAGLNLLDNSDFRNPVNQRGQTSYTVAGYTIDRWFSYDGISLTVSPFGFSGRELNQLLEGTMNGIHTLAAMKTDGTLLIKTGEISAAYRWSNSELAMGTHNGNTRISIPIGSYKWAALYEGSYTVETLPPYVPKGYAAELLECQRYFIAFQTYGDYVMPFAHGNATGETTARVEVSLPVPMRISTPSVAAEGVTWYLRSVGKNVAATVSVLRAIGNKLVLTAAVASGLTTYEQTTLAYYGQSGKTLYIFFSAEIGEEG